MNIFREPVADTWSGSLPGPILVIRLLHPPAAPPTATTAAAVATTSTTHSINTLTTAHTTAAADQSYDSGPEASSATFHLGPSSISLHRSAHLCVSILL